MNSEEKGKTRSKGLKKKILISVLVVIVLIFAAIVFLVPAYFSSDSGRRFVISRVNGSIDGRADISGLSVSWWKGVKLSGISFSDPLKTIVVKVRQVSTRLCYGSLLRGSLAFGETVIDSPQIEMTIAEDKQKTTAETSAPGKADSSVKRSAQAPVVLPIERIDLVVNDGSFKVTEPGCGSVEISDINSRLKLRGPGLENDLNLSMSMDQKQIGVNGQIKGGSKKRWSLGGTTGQLAVQVDRLSLSSLVPIFALAGADIEAAGTVTVDIKNVIKDGMLESSVGSIKASDILISGKAMKGDRLEAKRFNIDTALNRNGRMINIEKFDIDSDWLRASFEGSVPTTFKDLAQLTESKASLAGNFDLDLARVFSQMRNTIGLKEQMELTSGNLSGSVETFTNESAKALVAKLSLLNLNGMMDGKAVALSQPLTAWLEISDDQGKISYDKVDISSSFAQIKCSGKAEAIDYAVDIDLGGLQKELSQFLDISSYQLGGKVIGNGRIDIAEDNIKNVGSVDITNLMVRAKEGSINEPKAQVNFDFKYAFEKKDIALNSLEANGSFGTIKLTDTMMSLGQEPKLVKANLSADADLSVLKNYAVAFGVLDKQMQLQGQAAAKLKVESNNSSYHIFTDSTRIDGLKVSYPGKEPFEQSEVWFNFDGFIDPEEKSLEIKKIELISPQIKIKGTAKQITTGGQSQLDAKANLEYDWKAIISLAAPYMPKDLILEGKRNDSINLASKFPADQLSSITENLNTVAKLGFDRGEYMGLVFGATEITPEFKDGLFRIPAFSTAVNNGKFNFAASANFKDKPVLLRTPGTVHIVQDVEINDEMARKMLMFVNPIFAKAVNVRGVADFNCQKLVMPISDGANSDIEIIGTISIKQMRLEGSDLLGTILSKIGKNAGGEDITVHPTNFTVKDGFVHYEDMQIDVGDSPINFAGAIGLNKTLDMKVTLPYTIEGKAVRVGGENMGNRLVVSLKGTVDNPEIDLGALFEDQLKQRLQDELQKRLKDIFK